LSRGEEYTGIFLAVSGGAFNEDSIVASKYTPGGQYRISNKPLPGITDLATKIRRELDQNKRNDLLKQIQRDLAVLMPDIPIPGKADGFSLRQPWLKNHGVFYVPNVSARVNTAFWYDPSLKN
jgi:ABC-type transport system substrate-binding protein